MAFTNLSGVDGFGTRVYGHATPDRAGARPYHGDRPYATRGRPPDSLYPYDSGMGALPPVRLGPPEKQPTDLAAARQYTCYFGDRTLVYRLVRDFTDGLTVGLTDFHWG